MPITHNETTQLAALVSEVTELQLEELSRAVSNGQITLQSSILTVQRITGLPGTVASLLISTFRIWLLRNWSIETLLAAIQGAWVVRNQALKERPQVNLVWTGPIEVSTSAIARSTQSVLVDLIDSAQHDMLVVGYSITEGAAEIFKHLATASRRGVRVTIIGDRLEQRLDLLRSLWPANQRMPELYTRPHSPDDPMSALHAKLSIADQARMLVTSANLTYHGLAGNVEVGVLVNGKVASEAHRLIRELVTAGVLLSI